MWSRLQRAWRAFWRQDKSDHDKVWASIEYNRRTEDEQNYWRGVWAHKDGISRDESYMLYLEPQDHILRLCWEKGWDESEMALKSLGDK